MGWAQMLGRDGWAGTIGWSTHGDQGLPCITKLLKQPSKDNPLT